MTTKPKYHPRISSDAAEWLTAALDPYHDYQIRLEGLPDVISAPSVVKMHNQSYTLTAPASAAADWDAMIAFTGANTCIGLNPTLKKGTYGQVHLYDHAAPDTGAPFGSFVIKAAAAGTDMVFGIPITAGDTHVAFGASSNTSDRNRIIAVAFEVTNTTAAIYKQGSTTVAALPNPVSDFSTCMYCDTNAAPYNLDFKQSWLSPMYAANRGALLQIPGVSTWESAEGVYAIPRLCSMAGNVDCPKENLRGCDVRDSVTVGGHTTVPSAVAAIGGQRFILLPGVAASGFGALQVAMCGLSHETSLTVTMRTMVEYFPSFGSDMMPLATPSTAYCPKAFEVYSEIVRRAPYAVPVKQNAAGDYFRKILKIGGQVSSLLAPMAGPYAGYLRAAGAAASGAASLWQNKVDEKLRKRQPQRDGRVPPPLPLRVARKQAGAAAIPTRK